MGRVDICAGRVVVSPILTVQGEYLQLLLFLLAETVCDDVAKIKH